MSTQLVTRQQFEYSVVATFSDYANVIANRLMLTEVSEQELRKFKTINICQLAITDYFSRYVGEVPPTDDDNGLTKDEIENMVQLYNTLADTNFWYEFPEDEI